MISLRKINSVLIIIMILMLLHHAVLSALFLYGLIDYSPDYKITGRRLFYPLVAHIIISLYLYFKTLKVKKYSKLISPTTQQFITGIAIIVFASLHILSYMLIPPEILFEPIIRLTHLIIDISLFTSLILHLRVSIPRLLVTFGFLDGKNSYENFTEKFNIISLIILILLILAEISCWVII